MCCQPLYQHIYGNQRQQYSIRNIFGMCFGVWGGKRLQIALFLCIRLQEIGIGLHFFDVIHVDDDAIYDSNCIAQSVGMHMYMTKLTRVPTHLGGHRADRFSIALSLCDGFQ